MYNYLNQSENFPHNNDNFSIKKRPRTSGPEAADGGMFLESNIGSNFRRISGTLGLNVSSHLSPLLFSSGRASSLLLIIILNIFNGDI